MYYICIIYVLYIIYVYVYEPAVERPPIAKKVSRKLIEPALFWNPARLPWTWDVGM